MIGLLLVILPTDIHQGSSFQNPVTTSGANQHQGRGHNVPELCALDRAGTTVAGTTTFFLSFLAIVSLLSFKL